MLVLAWKLCCFHIFLHPPFCLFLSAWIGPWLVNSCIIKSLFMQVSKPGYVAVEKLMNIERYSHVMYISSMVSVDNILLLTELLCGIGQLEETNGTNHVAVSSCFTLWMFSVILCNTRCKKMLIVHIKMFFVSTVNFLH